ncbi:MAG TPA: tetratricopeptide repeat protein [Ramlibacter sp.]
MKALVVSGALLFAALAAQAADTPGVSPNVPQPTVQDRIASARKAVAKNDWSGALRELNVALREDPGNADVHNLMGYSYRKRASPDLAKAMEHYGMALKIDPTHKGAHEYIGEAYLIRKQLPDAERHLAELEKICGGTSCEEYRDLAKSIADFKARN